MYFASFEFQNLADFPAQRLPNAPGCKFPTSWVGAKVGLHHTGAQPILPGGPSRREHRTSNRHPVCRIPTSTRSAVTKRSAVTYSPVSKLNEAYGFGTCPNVKCLIGWPGGGVHDRRGNAHSCTISAGSAPCAATRLHRTNDVFWWETDVSGTA